MGKPVDQNNDTTPHSGSATSKSGIDPSSHAGSTSGETPHVPKVLPLRILYTEKFDLDDGVWRKREPDRTRAVSGATPAAVELLNAEAAARFDGSAGGLTDNVTLEEGQEMPKEFIAVVRPKSMALKKKGGTPGRTDQQSIVPDEMEMHLQVKLYDFAPSDADVGKLGGVASKIIYSGTTTATMKQDVQGLYCFTTSGNQLENLCSQIGTYMFHFSLVSKQYGEVPPAVVRVNVAPSQANMCSTHCHEKPSIQHRKSSSTRKQPP